MALEAVKLVAQAEQQSKDRKAEAVLEAKKRLADAEKAGQEALATTKKQADAKVKELLAQAETRRRMRQRSNSRPTRTVLHYGPTRKSGLKKRRH